MAKEANAMGFETAAKGESPTNGRDDTGRPYCGRHNVLMVAQVTKGSITHYKCPVDGCDEREKRVRTGIPVPNKPMQCGRSLCGGAVMEVDPQGSTSRMMLSMVCPKCRGAVEVARPGAARHLSQRELEPPGFDAR